MMSELQKRSTANFAADVIESQSESESVGVEFNMVGNAMKASLGAYC